MSQHANTFEAIREHFDKLTTPEQLQFVSDEFVKMTIGAEQRDLYAGLFFQMISMLIGAGVGGNGEEVPMDDKLESLELAAAMLFVGAEAASKGEITYDKFRKWAKRRDRWRHRRAAGRS